MKGLIIKDLLALKRSIKKLGLFCAFFILFGVMTNNPSYIGFMLIMFGSMMVFTTMANDEKVNWDKYAFTLPVTRKEIVSAKYAVWFILIVVTFLISLIAGGILEFLLGQNLIEFTLTMAATLGVYIYAFSILIPIVYKVGVEKARLVMFLIFMIPVGLIFAAIKLWHILGLKMINISELQKYIVVIPVVLVIMCIISYASSVAIVKKKEI